MGLLPLNCRHSDDGAGKETADFSPLPQAAVRACNLPADEAGQRPADPALYGTAWKKRERRFLDLLDSGQPLTISAEGKSYTLPAVDAPNWKKQFTDRC
jgi:hypothetical protein